MIKIILASLLLLSCKAKSEKEATPIEPAIKAKAQLYMSLHKGWSNGKCDSLGFTSLCKIAGGCGEADLFGAEDDGRWYRSPEKNCYDLGESASDISKDMFVMLFPYLYQTGDKAALRRIRSYALSNKLVMGRGEISRTLMTPPMVLMLNAMIDGIPLDISTFDEERQTALGFENHLDAVWIFTKGLVKGKISESDFSRIKSLKEDQPRNALFQSLYAKYDSGDQSEAIKILMDESLFPSDRLPTHKDRCEVYLWQRDAVPKDWQPCEKEGSHDGIDFLFAAFVAGQL